MATVALNGCAFLPPRRTPSNGVKAQIVYQDWRTDWYPAMAQQMLEEFHSSHPNIKVFFVPDPENLEDRMLEDMKAGSAADVFQGCCTHFPSWAQKGYTLDLQPYMSDLDRATIEDWDPVQFHSLTTRDGRRYGVPKYHGALALYFNKDIFDRYSVPYPEERWTHDDYLTAMRRLTRRNPIKRQTEVWGSMMDISWDRLQVLANSWGGGFVDPKDSARCIMGEPPTLQALEWLRARIWDDRVMATISETGKVAPTQAFTRGLLAMVEDGSWSLREVLSNADFRVGVAPLPAGPMRRATLATTDGFGIFAGTKHPDAAWELTKFLIDKPYGRAMARAHFLQPARASLVGEWEGFIREQYPDKAKEVNLAAFADGHVKGYSVIAEIFSNMVDAKKLAQDSWDQILTLGLLPVDSIRQLCRQIDALQPKTEGSTGGCRCDEPSMA